MLLKKLPLLNTIKYLLFNPVWLLLQDKKWKIDMHMNKNIWQLVAHTFIVFTLVSCGGGGSSSSNSPAVVTASSSSVQADVDVDKKANYACAAGSEYTLMITGGLSINSAMLEKMACTFFEVYPKIVTLLNPNAPKIVYFVFSDQREYPAYASDGAITFSKDWINSHPLDTDIVVHEATHIAQAALGEVPGWLVEGTADYVRDLYGLHNVENGWAIPIRYVPDQSYLKGYGDAAAFFKWVDAVYRQNQLPVVAAIYKSVAVTPYDIGIWFTLTGKDFYTLWYEYINFPVKLSHTEGVSLFLGDKFTGREIKLQRGNYDLLELLSYAVPDNEIASIKVPAGYKVKAYTDVNFFGAQAVFTTDTPMLDTSFKRKISSLVIE